MDHRGECLATGVFVQVRLATGVFVQVRLATGVFVQVRLATGVFVQVRLATGVFVNRYALPQVCLSRYALPQVCLSTGTDRPTSPEGQIGGAASEHWRPDGSRPRHDHVGPRHLEDRGGHQGT